MLQKLRRLIFGKDFNEPPTYQLVESIEATEKRFRAILEEVAPPGSISYLELGPHNLVRAELIVNGSKSYTGARPYEDHMRWAAKTWAEKNL